MSIRFAPQNDTDRMSCCEHTLAIREDPGAPTRLRQLRLVCVEASDHRWMNAYEACATLHGALTQAVLTRDSRLDAMMRAARRLFRGVFDTDGHSAPRALAECMNGLTPSALEDARLGTRLRALQKLRTALPGRIDVEFDAAAMSTLEAAIDEATAAVREVERARGAWRGSVVTKQEAAEEFDRDYRALVVAAKELGGAAWINAWFPAFAETNGDTGGETTTDEDLGALGELDIEGGDVDGPEEVSVGANGVA